MRIRKVTPVSVAYPEPNDDNNTRYLTLCRIEADDGTVGWGEAITQFPESTAATERLVEGLAPLVVGRDPMDNLDIWRRIKIRIPGWGPRPRASLQQPSHRLD
jgi:L-alanine-DL-glutamate epimerase-like enolase superfamily enzyme